MFKEYNTIEDVMYFAKDSVKKELNNTPLYVRAVSIMGYREIGIEVLDNLGQKCSDYASHNFVNGEINEIVNNFEKPNIIVKVKEDTLLEILHDVEHIKKHPLISFLKYAPKFHPKGIRDYTELLKLTTNVPKIFKNYNKA